MSAAAQARRLMPELEIVVIEKGRWTSYSACGIPYLAAGSVHGIEDLVVRTPEQFRGARIDVRTEHAAVGIDMDARRAGGAQPGSRTDLPSSVLTCFTSRLERALADRIAPVSTFRRCTGSRRWTMPLASSMTSPPAGRRRS